MTADTELEIKEAFQLAQKGHNNKAKLVASLKSRYNKVCTIHLSATKTTLWTSNEVIIVPIILLFISDITRLHKSFIVS